MRSAIRRLFVKSDYIRAIRADVPKRAHPRKAEQVGTGFFDAVRAYAGEARGHGGRPAEIGQNGFASLRIRAKDGPLDQRVEIGRDPGMRRRERLVACA